MTHFFAVWVVAAVLWRLNRPRFRRYAVLTITLTLAAFLSYWLYPAQPPWLHDAGVARIVPTVWDHLGVPAMQSVYEDDRLVNTVAAMPSLHAAYPFMLLLFFWSSAGGVGAHRPVALHARHGFRARIRGRALRRRHPHRLGDGRRRLRANSLRKSAQMAIPSGRAIARSIGAVEPN